MASWCPVSLCANTPILPVVMPNREYQMVQDLRSVNDAVVPIHTLVANPYNILVQVPGDAKWFTILDLKDAFFCIPVHPSSQYLFASEWTNTHSGQIQQDSWTVLPQVFQDSVHLFAQVLGKEQRERHLKERAILQYVDDILICSPTMEASDHITY